jgi:hypothetical protein
VTDSVLDTAAIAAHEMFLAYLRAGFTPDQALRIVIAMVTNTGNNQQQQSPETER